MSVFSWEKREGSGEKMERERERESLMKLPIY